MYAVMSHSLHVDCAACAARGPACSDCVISVLLGAPVEGVDLDTEEQSALSALAESGLVPPLRLVPRFDPAFEVRHPRSGGSAQWRPEADEPMARS